MENEKNDTKKTIKKAVKDWWDENGRVIKASIKWGLIGLAVGFIKGGLTVANMRLDSAETEDTADDDFVYDESNVDDPELLEMIRDGSIEE